MERTEGPSRWWGRVALAGCVLLWGIGIVQGQAQPNQTVAPGEAKPGPAPLPSPKPVCATAPLFSTDDIFYPGTEVMRIDLPTALRLANAGNPTIALARARVEEAYGRVRQAQLLWLPDLQAATSYYRHDGEIQNSSGILFQTSKSNASALGGAVLQVDSGEALFAPLIARRMAEAQAAASRAVNNNIQLDVATAYLELLRTYGQLVVNADLLARDREVLRRTREATKVGLAKTGADPIRAETEVHLRESERITLKGQVRVASSRLARLLLLQPTIALLPAEPVVVPVVLVPETAPADDLVDVGLLNRPELAEGRSLVAASLARQRQARLKPLLPQLQVYYLSGVFGGGQDASMSNFNGRGDGGAAAVWDLSNLGFGNIALNRVQSIQVREANLHVLEVQAQVSDEVNTAVQIARARREVLDSAQEAVRQAVEEYRRLDLIAFGMTAPKKLLETLEPLLAIQELGQARTQYLNSVIDYNVAQFQLYTAMGRPSADALPKAYAMPVTVPTVPVPYQPPKLP